MIIDNKIFMFWRFYKHKQLPLTIHKIYTYIYIYIYILFTYIHHLHTPLTYTTYIHHAHTPRTYTTHIHDAHTPRTYITHIHHAHTLSHSYTHSCSYTLTQLYIYLRTHNKSILSNWNKTSSLKKDKLAVADDINESIRLHACILSSLVCTRVFMEECG